MSYDVEVPTKGNLAVHIDDTDENLAQNDKTGGNLALVT